MADKPDNDVRCKVPAFATFNRKKNNNKMTIIKTFIHKINANYSKMVRNCKSKNVQ